VLGQGVGGARSFGDMLGCIAKGVFFFWLGGCAGFWASRRLGHCDRC